ncbi:hypothetical protein BKA61DRAFT_583180 [Leptodontidium sp. MPI-SDFR-AT-0119]|nr:hypothetical protein BKA61DRAFT_583180 [Leptodontidium sp. MPI-SDFR-AT-0119]
MLTKGELENVLSSGNPTRSYTPPAYTFKQAFEQSALLHPDLIAVESGSEVLTYAQLNNRANAVPENMLQASSSGGTVAIHADGSLNWIIGILGILKAGSTYCPLDLQYPLARRNDIVHLSNANGLLLPFSKQRKDQPPFCGRILGVDEILESVAGKVIHDIHVDSWEDDTILVFTSGTTGKPKGVPISNLGLLALQSNPEATLFTLPGRRIAQFMSPAFDYCTNEIFSALLQGGTLVLRDPANPYEHLKRANTATVTPSLLAVLEPSDYPNLDIVCATGEPVSRGLVER